MSSGAVRGDIGRGDGQGTKTRMQPPRSGTWLSKRFQKGRVCQGVGTSPKIGRVNQ